ncbi:hypothetical protein HQ571_06755 [Candidatus Kuenenbacteria bacterium]|nr:hypothetical protein [Candidatus Kuenenbacteria bacterium]
MKNKLILSFFIAAMVLSLAGVANAASLAQNLSGKILLQVEENGEAWYVYPEDLKRYYLGRPADAFDVMRNLGLGINEASYNQFNGTAPKNLSGKILLRVEANGEAYYVYPQDLKMHYLGRPTDAFGIMRNLGLGISTNNLINIEDEIIDCGVADTYIFPKTIRTYTFADLKDEYNALSDLETKNEEEEQGLTELLNEEHSSELTNYDASPELMCFWNALTRCQRAHITMTTSKPDINLGGITIKRDNDIYYEITKNNGNSCSVKYERINFNDEKTQTYFEGKQLTCKMTKDIISELGCDTLCQMLKNPTLSHGHAAYAIGISMLNYGYNPTLSQNLECSGDYYSSFIEAAKEIPALKSFVENNLDNN